MSEPEELPVMSLRLEGGGEFDATPLNTTLFTFLGRTAYRGEEVDAGRFDHVFIQTADLEDGHVRGQFIFRLIPLEEEENPTFHEMMDFMLDAEYPLCMYRRHVPECDKTAYTAMEDKIIFAEADDLDHIPDEWAMLE